MIRHRLVRRKLLTYSATYLMQYAFTTSKQLFQLSYINLVTLHYIRITAREKSIPNVNQKILCRLETITSTYLRQSIC